MAGAPSLSKEGSRWSQDKGGERPFPFHGTVRVLLAKRSGDVVQLGFQADDSGGCVEGTLTALTRRNHSWSSGQLGQWWSTMALTLSG